MTEVLQESGLGTVSDQLTVRDILTAAILRDAEVLAGSGGLDRPVRRLNVMTVPDIVQWTKEHEFMLSTGYPLPRREEELVDLVTQFSRRKLAAFGIKPGRYAPELPRRMLDTADRLALPIIKIPEDVAFDDILSHVFSDIVNRQAAAIARAQEIHRAFLQIVLSGGQLPEIAVELSELLHGAAVLVSDGDGRILATAINPQQHRRLVQLRLLDRQGRLRISHLAPGTHTVAGDLTLVVAPIRAGNLQHGHLVAAGPPELMGQDAIVAIDQAAVVAALDVTRRLAISAVERQFESSVLHDLVTGVGTDIDDALARSAAFGWDLDRPLVVLVSRAEWTPGTRKERSERDLAQQRYIDLWCSEIRKRDRDAAAAAFATELVAVVGAGDDPAAVPRAVWSGLKAATRREFSIGVSRPFHDPRRIPAAYEEARKALHMGRRTAGPGKVTLFADLGLFRLLSLVEDIDELRAFVSETLGGLLRLEPKQSEELLKTLEVLLDKHLNVAEASRALHFHYNSMRYRIAKLEKLVGPFTTDSALCLRLSVALQALEMHEVASLLPRREGSAEVQ